MGVKATVRRVPALPNGCRRGKALGQNRKKKNKKLVKVMLNSVEAWMWGGRGTRRTPFDGDTENASLLSADSRALYLMRQFNTVKRL